MPDMLQNDAHNAHSHNTREGSNIIQRVMLCTTLLKGGSLTSKSMCFKHLQYLVGEAIPVNISILFHYIGLEAIPYVVFVTNRDAQRLAYGAATRTAWGRAVCRNLLCRILSNSLHLEDKLSRSAKVNSCTVSPSQRALATPRMTFHKDEAGHQLTKA
eukprot:1153277-Pelagomonas_calceolata.AAC.7